MVEPTPEVAGEDPESPTHDHPEHDREPADGKTDTGPVDRAGEHIAPQGVGAEEMLARWALPGLGADVSGIVERKNRSEHRQQGHEDDPADRDPETDAESPLDEFLGRRSRDMRRSLVKGRRRTETAGVEIEVGDALDPTVAFDRISAVEANTWKGRDGVGFVASGMGPFYRSMIRRLSERGGLRLRFARRGGRDLAYIFGGLFAGTYRGLQFGYHADCRDLALGNFCQLHQIEALCGEGVRSYDLGTTGDHYKTRWSDRQITSTAMIVVRE